MSGHPGHELARITPVGPNQLYPGETSHQGFEHRLGPIPILNPGGVDAYYQQQTQDIDHQMAFAASEALAAVIATDPALFRRLISIL